MGQVDNETLGFVYLLLRQEVMRTEYILDRASIA